MIKSTQSLKTNFEFYITRKYGTYYNLRYFHLYILKPLKYKGISKIGIVLSKKYDKKAVARNRVKRLFKIAFKDFLNNTQDLYVVVHPKAICKDKTSQQIKDEVEKAIKNIKLPK